VSGRTDWAAAPADAPHIYQEYMVPAMFAPLAERVAELVEAGPGDRALDVACQQALQFFPDKAAVLGEFRRVVAPGGRVAVACWCDLESSFGFDHISRALDRHLGTEAGDMIRYPFVVISDPAALRGLFEASGFDDVVIEIERVAARFPEPERFAEHVIAAGPISAAFAAASEQQRRAVIEEVAAALEPARDGDWVTFEMPALVAVARV
jgi:SAM-dependent methyltransferase